MLIERTRSGQLDAYGDLVRRFQDMAVDYAYSLLGDFHLAEDAAQEAFVRAYLELSELRQPEIHDQGIADQIVIEGGAHGAIEMLQTFVQIAQLVLHLATAQSRRRKSATASARLPTWRDIAAARWRR